MRLYSGNDPQQRWNIGYNFWSDHHVIKICSVEARSLWLVVQSYELPFHSWASNEASSLLLKKSMLLCSPAISSLKDRRKVLMHQKCHTQHVVCSWLCAAQTKMMTNEHTSQYNLVLWLSYQCMALRRTWQCKFCSSNILLSYPEISINQI